MEQKGVVSLYSLFIITLAFMFLPLQCQPEIFRFVLSGKILKQLGN